ncbi:colicin release lysis protein, partial [Escherichia coli]
TIAPSSSSKLTGIAVQ